MNPTKVSWNAPAANTDGSPIAAGEITGYTLGVRLISAAGSVAGAYPVAVDVPSNPTEGPLTVFGPLKAGDYAAAARAIGPNDSAWSAEATFTIAPVPAAPTGFSVA